MIVPEELEKTIATLEQARGFAVSARMDEHFIHEIDHLIATAKANEKG